MKRTTKTRRRSCEGKVAYKKREAQRVAYHRRQVGAFVRAYRCGYCPSWHVGHRGKPAQGRR